MANCWKCSAELTDSPRCEGCGMVNSIEDIHIDGIIRDDDEVTVYAVADGPGHLVIDLHKKKGLLSQLPKPTKKGALESKAFKNIWKRTTGDHLMLQDATPQRYEAMGDKSDKLLFVEVHGLSVTPSPAKTTNGVSSDTPALLEAQQELEEQHEEESRTLVGRLRRVGLVRRCSVFFKLCMMNSAERWTRTSWS